MSISSHLPRGTSEALEFANGKPLHFIDGAGLLSICQEHGTPARILGLGRRKPKSSTH